MIKAPNKIGMHALAGHNVVRSRWIHWYNGVKTGCEDCQPGIAHRNWWCVTCTVNFQVDHWPYKMLSPYDKHRMELKDASPRLEFEEDQRSPGPMQVGAPQSRLQKSQKTVENDAV